LRRRSYLLSWWIGLIVVLAAVLYFAYRFSCLECGHPGGAVEFIVLFIIPVVYLALMYLTLWGQAEDETHPPPRTRG
jgi:hypothetical protein